MEVILYAAIIIGAIVGALYLSARYQRRKKAAIKIANQIIDIRSAKLEVKTPKGVTVRSINPVQPEYLAAIDVGLTRLFERCVKHGYKLKQTHIEYGAYVMPHSKDSGTEDIAPDFEVNRPETGKIFVAGMVQPQHFDSCFFTIPECELKGSTADRDRILIENVADYEGEHIVLFHNNRPEFDRTALLFPHAPHPVIE